MSYAEIVSGGADGRYVIRLDWGEARKAQMLAQVGAAIVKLEAQVLEQQTKIAEADAIEAGAKANLQTFMDLLIQGMGPSDAGSNPLDAPAMKAYDEVFGRVRTLILKHQPVRDALVTLRMQLQQAYAMAAYWNNFQASETRPAWCCDLTENASGQVATVDIPGDSNLMLIAPGGRGWQPGDGVLTARELMSPAQAFFNAAVFPGWQKHRPTYRWGTITAIDYGAGTADVSLADARSSAQRLPINAKSSLLAVPVSYMTCNAEAFEVGDQVVVQFVAQDWASPRIIGFVDTPRSCRPWPDLVHMDLTFLTVAGAPSGSKKWGVVHSDNPCGTMVKFVNFHPIAAPGDHTLRLDQPFFGSAQDAANFEIETDGGRFGDVWSGHSAAFGFGTGVAPGYAVPVGGACNSYYALASGVPHNIAVVNETVPSYAPTGTWVSFFGANCVATGYESCGAWFDPVGLATEVVISAHIVDWLASVAAMPTVKVRRRGSSLSKEYVYYARDETILEGNAGLPSRSVRWRMYLRKK